MPSGSPGFSPGSTSGAAPTCQPATRRRAPWLPLLLALLTLAPAAAGQPAADAEPDEAPRPGEQPPGEPGEPGEPTPPKIVPPKPIGDTAVLYPEGASGDAQVVLELVVETDGSVADATVVSGDAPFADVALQAARGWQFSPATRGGQAVRARIRFSVRFVEPEPEPEPEPELEPAEPAASAATDQPAKVAKPKPIDVTVVGEKPAPGKTTLTRAEVRQLPGAFGDPFRAVEAMPGVTPLVSGVPFFFVRGAPPGNVGYFLDGIRVPLLYHIGLGPSVVHPAIVDRVDLYPGGYPARYGRFAGGIVAGETTPPERELHGEASVRLVDSGALVEAPFAERRGTALAGGRYSYTALVLSLFAPEVELEYWDYQARATYDLTPKDTLMLFSFGAFDYLAEEQPNGDEQILFSTEFHRLDLRYEHRPSQRTKLQTAVTLGIDRTRGEDELMLRDRILAARAKLEHRENAEIKLRTGADVQADWYDVRPPESNDPQDQDPEDIENRNNFERLFPSRTDLVAGVWGDLVLDPEPGVTVTPGLRVDFYTSNGDHAVAFEPRVAARFEVTERWRILHALGVAHQAPSFVIPVPGFQLAGLDGGLQQSLQASSGVEVDLPEAVTASLTVFDNVFLNMTDALGAGRGGGDDVDRFTRRSLGNTIGVELFVKRPLTKTLGGFLSYTLSRSTRSVGRESFPSSFDRTHVLNVALAYDLGRRWRAGTRFVFYTGFPNEEQQDERLRTETPARIPPFYRVDLRLEKRWQPWEKGSLALVFEMLNATLNKEVVDVSCSSGRCEPEEIGPVAIPSIGLEAVF